MSVDRGDGSKGPKSSHYKANNEGGFGNPPVKNQFRKGGSGGPGRKKGGRNIEAALQKMFGGRVVVRQNGKQSSTTMNNAIAERVKQQLLQGPQRGLEYGLELAKKYGPPKEEPIILNLSMLSDDELALYGLFAILTSTPANVTAEEAGIHRIGVEPGDQFEIYKRENGFLGLQKVET